MLLVDDEEAVLKITGELLSAYVANEIVLTSDPEHALALLERESFGVVLCDLYMPKLTGDKVLRYAHKVDSNSIGVLVTARATKDVIIDGMNKGYIWKCLEKPWLPGDLVAVAKDALDAYGQRCAQTAAPAPDGASVPEVEPVHAASDAVPPRPPTTRKKRRIVVQKRDLQATHDAHESPLMAKLRNKRIAFVGPTGRRSEADRGHARERFEDQSLRTIRLQIKPAVAGDGHVESAPDTWTTELCDGRFSFHGRIQQGGFGCVFKAWDSLLAMPVALKVLPDDLASDRGAIDLLLTEARAAMQLSHKHIVRLHNIHEEQGRLCLVMEYIEGMTLREMIARDRALDLDVVILIARVIGDALGYAHRHGVYHRDLKPDNIMVSSDGVLKIIDFGMACMAQQVRQRDEICGTPFYMSPEEIAGDMLDQRVDVYAMGVLLHELLTGELPLAGDEPDIDFLKFIPVCSPLLQDPLRCVLARAMAVDRAARWPDVGSLVNGLVEAGQSVTRS